MAMKNNAFDGSILMVVASVMATFLLLSTIFIRSGTQTCDLALQRIAYQQRACASEGLVRYGGWLIDEYRESLSALASGTHIEHTLDAWPMAGIKPFFKATITIEIQEQCYRVTTALLDTETIEKSTLYARA
jgi:hypothetical protein